ncbi:MAG: hypothetical protein ACFFD4_18290 [Candidatus Odinarchaeota archaeon]
MADRNQAGEQKSASTACLTCTWDDNSDCINCEVSGKLNCKWDQKILMNFVILVIPAFIPIALIFGLAGLTASWLPTILFVAYAGFFFFFLEIKVLCSHCPYYAEDKDGTGNTFILHCHANHGCPKFFTYNPAPLNRLEKAGFLAGASILLIIPIMTVFYMIYGMTSNGTAITDPYIIVLALLVVLLLLASFYVLSRLRKNFCSFCVHFSCPSNLVPKHLVDAYLEKNPAMMEAWVKAGYKLG